MNEFIPKPEKIKPITFRISEIQIKQLDKAAAAFHLSRSQFINQCIDYAISHLEPSAETKSNSAKDSSGLCPSE